VAFAVPSDTVSVPLQPTSYATPIAAVVTGLPAQTAKPSPTATASRSSATVTPFGSSRNVLSTPKTVTSPTPPASPSPLVSSTDTSNIIQASGQDLGTLNRSFQSNPSQFDLLLQPRGDFPPMTVHGGITVPFYFVLLAMIGAAVSLARRVPEYQRRILNEKDKLWAPDAREALVFQIMQFIAAPLIGITAYVMLKPESSGASVVLGFISGFSSESILLAIRSMADKLDLKPSTKE
jgi:hypothetical protein